MTSTSKGSMQSLDRIKVPKFDWYYSAAKAKLYHYDKEVFGLYAVYSPQVGLKPTNPTKLFIHYHLKVLPEVAVCAEIWIDEDYIHPVTVYKSCKIWIEEVTNPKEIEQIILERNKCHLQQAGVKEDRVYDLVMQKNARG